MVQMQSMTFGYGKKPLFEGFDLSLEPGSINGLLGLNGAGKTSLLKIAAGALRPSLGKVEVFGRNPSRREASFLADVAFVPEDPWFPALKPVAWVDRMTAFRPAFDRKRFEVLSEELGLDAGKVVSKFSYGQRKKFALAVAIASGARLLLLDEPTNGLDIPSKVQFRRVLASAVGPDRIVVVSTHQVRDLESLIDPIIIVNNGRVAFSLAASELGSSLRVERLSSLDGRPVVYAERDAVGWTALLSTEPSQGLGVVDLELLFNAAIAEPERLKTALSGQSMSQYRPASALSTMGDRS